MNGMIGCDPAEMADAESSLNREAGLMESAATTLQTKIDALEGLWKGAGHDAFVALTGKMKVDFDNGNQALQGIAKEIGDFGLRTQDMDTQHAKRFSPA
jgi:WXG100 family type VII secretion target